MRRKTRIVPVGSVAIGGDNPIRLQSMTTTDTMDTAATVAQTLRLVDVGCEIVRITAPTPLDAQNLEKIKSSLINKGCRVPLVADIHFRPDAALIAADFVEKVRVNPGNFVDGKAFKLREYTDEQYEGELKRLEDKFTPLVLKLKKLKRALRIGTNHGSLSDRIMNRYGDTPLGMVESALEFVRICEKNDYRDVVFSMKASNVRVMITAYRLLAARMRELGMDYPFHLGVTEAGDGEDGRIKSAVGIGSLLEDGIGDTIRVSLTEDPEYEIPVAREIAEGVKSPNFDLPFSKPKGKSKLGDLTPSPPSPPSPVTAERRLTRDVPSGPIIIGGTQPIRVVSRLSLKPGADQAVLSLMEERLKKDTPPEIIEIPYFPKDFAELYKKFREQLAWETSRLAFWIAFEMDRVPVSLELPMDGLSYRCDQTPDQMEWKRLIDYCSRRSVPLILNSASEDVLLELAQQAKSAGIDVIIGLENSAESMSVHPIRTVARRLTELKISCPLLLRSAQEKASLDTAIVEGSLICDGLGDAVLVSTADVSSSTLDFSYNLLQACGSRITKTEFVSCPSCGRTLFDLQSTTERIKKKTGHLKGVKIAIMGCIVNGPGEMADADFGYVGGGPGKINLYVGKTCVEKSIPMDVADEKLIELIKQHERWVDPIEKIVLVGEGLIK